MKEEISKNSSARARLIITLHNDGLSNDEIAGALKHAGWFDGCKEDSVRRIISREIAKATKGEDNIVAKTEQKEEELPRFCLNVGNEYETAWNGDRIIRFGLVSDTHINSKYTQLTHLHEAYRSFGIEGIQNVYHCGDIGEGDQMRMGHQYECYAHGADDQRDEIIRVYPKIKGITTHFITGNHDHSFIKRQGYDIGSAISMEREDMKYLGQAQAFINLTPNCKLELRHPEDGSAYSLSYKVQKQIEAMSGGEKSSIYVVGHYHKSEYLFYRNVHCFQAGTLCAQTSWMRGKGISASMGYWLVEVHVNDDGQVNIIKPYFFPFYRAIKDDYISYRR